jgi:small-conductance mechanosensitive channel
MPPIRSLSSVRAHGEVLRSKGMTLLHVGFVVLWVWITLRQFQLQSAVARGVRSALDATLKVRSFEISAGAVLAFVLVLFAAAAASRIVRFFLDEDVLPRIPLKRGVGATISTTIHYAVLLLGLFAALAAAGIELSRFTVLAGAFGIGLAFGMQNVVNNFVSGLILLFERPIQVGDTVQLGTVTGEVRRIGVRSSTVRTFEGAEVIVPNADLISKEVVNWTLSDRNRRIEITVGVAYGTDPARVIEILSRAASAHADVLGEPGPVVLFTGLGESSLDFSLRFWTARFESHLNVRSDVLAAAYSALREAGIEIPFPQRDVHVKSAAAEPSR